MSRIQYDRLRCSQSRRLGSMEIPSLVDLQRSSYEQFLAKKPSDLVGDNVGIGDILSDLFYVDDEAKGVRLEFVDYRFEDPVYTIDEARRKSLTYSAALRAKLRLTLKSGNAGTDQPVVREQEVYLGDFPIMTTEGTFVVAGVERVVVSQLHRSPGIFFDVDKSAGGGKKAFSARITPAGGSWLDFEFDAKNMFYVRIDRKRKMLLTSFLSALASDAFPDDDAVGMSREEMVARLYGAIDFVWQADKGLWSVSLSESLLGRMGVLDFDLVDAKKGVVLAAKGTKVDKDTIQGWGADGVDAVLVPDSCVEGRFLARDVVDQETGEALFDAGKMIIAEDLELLRHNADPLSVVDTGRERNMFSLHNTLMADKVRDRNQAVLDIYRTLRPGERANFEGALEFFNNLFFNPERYNLSEVGRLKLNKRLELDAPLSLRVLTKDDIFAVVRYMLGLRSGQGRVDDVDSLTNRRVRAVGELLSVQFRAAIPRMRRSIRERIAAMDTETVLPSDLINSRPLSSLIREFFGTFQLSQFMDQTNPLSEFNHKRRLSALGPGGVTRERALVEIRDVHPTHYGRICCIETPEGSNIGLIMSLAVYARINKYGFLETPYRKVVNGVLSDEVVYASPLEEEGLAVAQADSVVDDSGVLSGEVGCRRSGDYTLLPANQVDFIDVAPKQIFSLAGTLIPFLENNDANRALMGANMMRQAVPLLRCEAPLVGTGSESLVIRDSDVSILARRAGVVDQADAHRIVVRPFDLDDTSASSPGGRSSVVDVYHLQKFRKSNDGTCIHQKALCVPGQHVEKGDLLADGSATVAGDLALGRNIKVAFAMLDGLGFEDSIILSQALVDSDAFTSIHIKSFSVEARETKIGAEEICFDVPFASEESTRNLDEAGIVSIGSKVVAGDILVGRVSPKAESPLTAEEKLLRAIFAGKAGEMKDSSLRVPPGVSGTVVDVRVSVRRGTRDEDLDERTLAIRRHYVARLVKERDVEHAALWHGLRSVVADLLDGHTLAKNWGRLKAGDALTSQHIRAASEEALKKVHVVDKKVSQELTNLIKSHDASVEELRQAYVGRTENLVRGDELAPGVLKKVEVFVAVKRKIRVGDKMAGRHGNKGVVSSILPKEDMPLLDDGTRVDAVLGPLGTAARMNLGQIYETHTGYACMAKGKRVKDLLAKAVRDDEGGEDMLRRGLKDICGDQSVGQFIDTLSPEQLFECAQQLTNGVPIAIPPFEGLSCDQMGKMLESAGLNSSGQERLRDGRTGEYLDRPVTVGVKYMLKLHHLVDEKLHARSVGPYSLITQQPLGGRSQSGGQRLGEMEVWALEAYAACTTLLEMLTIKSDDIKGRTEAYKSIVNGVEDFSSSCAPESWRVLERELNTLGICVDAPGMSN